MMGSSRFKQPYVILGRPAAPAGEKDSAFVMCVTRTWLSRSAAELCAM